MIATARGVMSSLQLYALSDAFSGIWSKLAAECGLRLEPVESPAELAAGAGQVGIVAAGGEEAELETVLAEIGRGREVAAVGAQSDHRLAVSVVRAGAVEYFSLPGDFDLLRSWLREAAERARARTQRTAFASDQARKYNFEGILGESRALAAALEQAARVIPHPRATVLIAGETGTGKELLARAIHYNGPRREGPFVDINCAAIPENLLESELFGHEKGAFTGAGSAKPGLFEEADGGTLFLDEIGHLALPLQGKLLRALEERRIRRVGGTRSIDIDVRVIAASHVDLAAAVRGGEFREDLYWRLNVIQLQLPPLRARREDVLPLARHFLASFAAEYGAPEPRLTAAAERALLQREWTGNVRELRNIMERAILLARGSVLDVEDFAPPPSTAPAGVAIPFPAPLADIIRAAVARTVERTGGNKSEAARALHISRTRLLRLLDPTAVDVDEGNGHAL